jgi:hypothetical protein
MSNRKNRKSLSRSNAPSPGFQRVKPWLEWLADKGLSRTTGERLRKARKIKLTQLGPRRIGVSEEQDREYMEAAAAEAESRQRQS